MYVAYLLNTWNSFVTSATIKESMNDMPFINNRHYSSIWKTMYCMQISQSDDTEILEHFTYFNA